MSTLHKYVPIFPMPVKHKLDENTSEIVQLKHYVRATSKNSLLMTPTDFDILVVTLFTWSLKVRFS